KSTDSFGNYVITEDDYIDYMTFDDGNFLPNQIISKMTTSSILFLGYSLRDWNLRVLLSRILKRRSHSYTWWAVQHRDDQNSAEQPLIEKMWHEREIELHSRNLKDYVNDLESQIRRAQSFED